MNKNLQRLAEPGGRLYLIFLVLFAAAALFFKMYELAVAEGVIILILMIYSFFSRRRRAKQLESYIESVTYDTENAKNNTLMNFPAAHRRFPAGRFAHHLGQRDVLRHERQQRHAARRARVRPCAGIQRQVAARGQDPVPEPADRERPQVPDTRQHHPAPRTGTTAPSWASPTGWT